MGVVFPADYVVMESFETIGFVPDAGCIPKQRSITGGVIGIARSVAIERFTTDSRVDIIIVVIERSPTDSNVICAAHIKNHRLKTNSRICVGGVGLERLSPNSRILDTVGEAKERLRTKRGVVATCGKAGQCSTSSLSRISARVASVRCRANPSRRRGKRKAGEHKRNEKQTGNPISWN